MPVYEHVSGERQHTAEGTLTDTELGVKALDPGSGWQRVDLPPPAVAPPDEPAPEEKLPPADDTERPEDSDQPDDTEQEN